MTVNRARPVISNRNTFLLSDMEGYGVFDKAALSEPYIPPSDDEEMETETEDVQEEENVQPGVQMTEEGCIEHMESILNRVIENTKELVKVTNDSCIVFQNSLKIGDWVEKVKVLDDVLKDMKENVKGNDKE